MSIRQRVRIAWHTRSSHGLYGVVRFCGVIWCGNCYARLDR